MRRAERDEDGAQRMQLAWQRTGRSHRSQADSLMCARDRDMSVQSVRGCEPGGVRRVVFTPLQSFSRVRVSVCQCVPQSPVCFGVQKPQTSSKARATQKEFYNQTPSHDTRHGTGAHWH